MSKLILAILILVGTSAFADQPSDPSCKKIYSCQAECQNGTSHYLVVAEGETIVKAFLQMQIRCEEIINGASLYNVVQGYPHEANLDNSCYAY